MLFRDVAPEKLDVASSGVFCFAIKKHDGVRLIAEQNERAQCMSSALFFDNRN
jgi:hypothetical protein